jgi:molybdenum cofactor cytidylyltransferase
VSGVAAIVAAAGLSRRMGRCKQLLELGGKTALARCLETLGAGGIREIVVVVGVTGELVATEAGRFPVQVVINNDPGGDMASSLRVGRAALAAAASAVIVALCDYPLVLPATVSSLVECHAEKPEHIIIPCHGGRRGHPLLVPRAILDELQGELTLRDLVRRDPHRLHFITVDDPGILTDMDSPEDYLRLCAQLTVVMENGDGLTLARKIEVGAGVNIVP